MSSERFRRSGPEPAGVRRPTPGGPIAQTLRALADRVGITRRRVRAERTRIVVASVAIGLLAWAATGFGLDDRETGAVAEPDRTEGGGADPIQIDALGDRRSLTLPLPLAAPAVEPGQRVDLVAVVAGPDWTGAEARVVATATVVMIDELGLTVVCERDEALAVVEALALGTVEVLGR